MASEGSFKPVCRFDPDDVEKAKQRVISTGDLGNFGEATKKVGIPFSFEAQVYELRRIFRR